MLSRQLLGVAFYSVTGALVAPHLVTKATLVCMITFPEYRALVLAVNSATSEQLFTDNPASTDDPGDRVSSSEDQANYAFHEYAS